MDYSEAAPTKVTYSLQIDYWQFKSFKIVTNQNDHKSVAYLMYSLIACIDNLLENYNC